MLRAALGPPGDGVWRGAPAWVRRIHSGRQSPSPKGTSTLAPEWRRALAACMVAAQRDRADRLTKAEPPLPEFTQ